MKVILGAGSWRPLPVDKDDRSIESFRAGLRPAGPFFSGAVSLIGGLDGRHGYAIARRSELAAWQHAIVDIPPEDRFACVPDYNHPLILLGRKVACGYEGHLWSHGLNSQGELDSSPGPLAAS